MIVESIKPLPDTMQNCGSLYELGSHMPERAELASNSPDARDAHSASHA